MSDLGIAYQRLGDLFKDEEEYGQAKEYYKKAAEVGARVVEAAPDDLGELSDISVLYFHLGALSHAEGENAQAKGYYEKALKTLQKIVDSSRTISTPCAT